LLRRRPNAAADFVSLAGAAVLAAIALAAVPWSRGLVRPRTPLDASSARFLVPAYELISDAAAVIPPGASFVVRTEPPNATSQELFQRLGVALLPERRSRPDAVPGLPAAADWPRGADYLIVVGGAPRDASVEIVLETPRGTVRRRPR
jgi:hypothetical protein